MFGHAILKNYFLVLNLEDFYNNSSSTFVLYSNFESVKSHVDSRLGYIGQDRMSSLTKEGLLGRITKVKLPRCESCLVKKATTKPFGKALNASSSLDLFHSDIYDPIKC